MAPVHFLPTGPDFDPFLSITDEQEDFFISLAQGLSVEDAAMCANLSGDQGAVLLRDAHVLRLIRIGAANLTKLANDLGIAQ